MRLEYLGVVAGTYRIMLKQGGRETELKVKPEPWMGAEAVLMLAVGFIDDALQGYTYAYA